MCVCDLGGVYIKPTRPWVVAPLPSPLATVTLSPRLAVSPRHLVTSSPRHLVHLVTWSPGYLFTSGHLVAWLPCCLVTWSRCAVICSRLRVFHLRAHLFDLPCFPIRPCQIHSLLCASASFHSRFNPYFPCPDFTDSMHFLSRIFFFELLTLTKRAL